MENQNEFRENQYYGNLPISLPNSTAVLVLGIVSIVFCFCYGVIGIICGIIALVLYAKDKKLYDANPQAYTPSSFNNLKSGRICAIIGLILSALCLVIMLGWIIFFGMAMFTDPQHFLDQMR